MLPSVMPRPFVTNKDVNAYAYAHAHIHARMQNQQFWRRNTMRAVLVTCAVIGIVNVGKALLISSVSASSSAAFLTSERLYKPRQPVQPASTPTKPPSLRGREFLTSSKQLKPLEWYVSDGDDSDESMDKILHAIVNEIVARRATAVIPYVQTRIEYEYERERRRGRERRRRPSHPVHLVDIKIAKTASSKDNAVM